MARSLARYTDTAAEIRFHMLCPHCGKSVAHDDAPDHLTRTCPNDFHVIEEVERLKAENEVLRTTNVNMAQKLGMTQSKKRKAGRKRKGATE